MIKIFECSQCITLYTESFTWYVHACMDSPGGAVVKNLPASAGDARDADSILGWGRSPGGRNGNLHQDSVE